MSRDSYQTLYSLPARFLAWCGAKFSDSFAGKVIGLFFSSIRHFWVNSRKGGKATNSLLLNQIYFTGVEAVPLVLLIAWLFGTVVVMQALTVMPKVGFGGFFGNIMVIVIIRELGPVLTAFIVTGRTGAALATFVGNMKVNSEVDSLESMGINSVRYLVMPAVVGAMVGMVCLSALFSAVAITCGFGFAKLAIYFLNMSADIDAAIFFNEIFAAMKITDVVMMIVKPLVFGIIISTLACYNGLKLTTDPRKVPVAAGQTVVSSYALILIADVLLSAFYLGQYARQLQGVI